MVPLPFDLNGRDIEIEAGQFVAERFALGRDKEPMELLCKRVESRHGLACFATLPQKGMQLIHGVAITGQEITGLPCWHGGSPLA
jgi:hypothetical protein